MKATIVTALLLVFFAAGVYATNTTSILTSSTGGSTSLLSSFTNGFNLGMVKTGSAEVGMISWNPDFKLGPWALGLDFNIPLGSQNTAGIQNIVFRYAEYNDGNKGLRYGVLDSVTLGHGLIMKDYTTRSNSNVVLTNDQMGLKGYYGFGPSEVDGMATWSHIYQVGAKQKVHPRLTLTEYYVADVDGVNVVQTDGSTRNFPAQSAFGVDATVPIMGNWDLFAEAGQMANHGNGYGVGTGWAFDLLKFISASFSFTYRMLDQGFVPGYFNIDYESNPIDLSSVEASGNNKNGYVGELALAMANRLEATLTYEDYNDSNPALTGQAAAIITDQISATAYYKQENFADFRSLSLEEGAILGGSLTYKINAFTSLTVNYKRAYNASTGQVEESQYYEMGFGF
jgi:hypothetical protein